MVCWQSSLNASNDIIALPEIGDSAGALISPQQEYAIGLSYYWQLQHAYDLIDDPEVIKQFSEATNSVIAMSLIHEKIYQTDHLSDIDISSYFETLTKELIS